MGGGGGAGWCIAVFGEVEDVDVEVRATRWEAVAAAETRTSVRLFAVVGLQSESMW